MGYEKESLLVLHVILSLYWKKNFLERPPKIQMLMFGLAKRRLWDITSPPPHEFQLAFNIYYVKYENTLRAKRLVGTRGGGGDVLEIFFYFLYE